MRLEGKQKLNLEINLTLNEEEALALQGITSYGADQFIEWFYKNLGRSYLQPHENGLRTLFAGIRHLSPYLQRNVDAQDVFKGIKKAISIDKAL